MNKFIVKPSKDKPDPEASVKAQFDIFTRGRYGKHVKVGSILEFDRPLTQFDSCLVRFDRKVVPISQAEGMAYSRPNYVERKRPVIFYFSDIEAAKLAATHLLKVTILTEE